MKLALFGATGPLGRAVMTEAAAAGYQLRVLSRRPLDPAQLPGGVEVVIGDYFDPGVQKEVLQGAGAAISTIGPAQNRKAGSAPEEYARAMQDLISAMRIEGIDRILTVASMGTRFGAENYGVGRRLLRVLIHLAAPRVIPAKEAELAVLARSDLNWTTVRPPLITSGRGGRLPRNPLRATDLKPNGRGVDKRALARFLVEQIDHPTWSRRAPFVAS